jgi:hypothetical protein
MLKVARYCWNMKRNKDIILMSELSAPVYKGIKKGDDRWHIPNMWLF